MLSRALHAFRQRRERPALLVVDDEPIIRVALDEALLRAGHRVITVAHADQAADLLRRTDYQLAALICAVELEEGQSGWELASLARQLRPNIPVLYLSSFSEAAWATKGVPRSKLMQKPFDAAEVVSRVGVLLNEEPASAGLFNV